VAAEGEGIVVAYDYGADRKTTLPADIRHRIATIEGW
ncbi:MAG: acyl-CoA thioesterase, partial [Gemmatimonadales bacterium]|nr:acyl-CoA thioesterase [Gemmatimonadales bacterium]